MEKGHYIGFLYYPRTPQNMPYRRASGQVFGHTALWINNLVYNCDLHGSTCWYDAEEFMDRLPPFISVEFPNVTTDIHKATTGIVAGLEYNLRAMAREVKDSVSIPNAVTCVWGGRQFLRNIGVECNARTPDELLRETLRLTEPVQGTSHAYDCLGEGSIVVWPGGFQPDSVFAR